MLLPSRHDRQWSYTVSMGYILIFRNWIRIPTLLRDPVTKPRSPPRLSMRYGCLGLRRP